MSHHHPHPSSAQVVVGLGLLAASNRANLRQAQIDAIWRSANAAATYYNQTGFITDAGQQAIIEREHLRAAGCYPSWDKPQSADDTLALMVVGGFLGFMAAVFISFTGLTDVAVVCLFVLPIVGAFALPMWL